PISCCASPSRTARGRSSCRLDRQWHRRRPERPLPPPLLLSLLEVTTKALAHGREHLVLKLIQVPRSETFEEGCSQHVRRYPFVVRRLECPAPLARVRHSPAETRQIWLLRQRLGREVQQPRGDHAAPTPDLRDAG